MNKIFILKNASSPKKDNCNKCLEKICCKVFSIIDESNGGSTIVKIGDTSCTYLNNKGSCSIYDTRDRFPGFMDCCQQYTCHNIGPLMDKWLRENNITIIGNSSKIGLILTICGQFVSYGQINDNLRYNFISKFFIQFDSLSQLMEACCDLKSLEGAFSIWIWENSDWMMENIPDGCQ